MGVDSLLQFEVQVETIQPLVANVVLQDICNRAKRFDTLDTVILTTPESFRELIHLEK